MFERRFFIVVVLVGSSACQEHPAPFSPSDSWSTLTGHVTATNGGQPLGGLVVDLGSQTTGTDVTGGFALSNLASGSQRLSLTGSTIRVALASGGRRVNA